MYVKGTIQPFLSAHSSQHNSSDGVVPKEKLCELWVKNKKNAVEIMKNSNVLPGKIQPVINKEKTEEYFSGKYENIQSTVHANILESCEDVNSSEVALFRTEEIKEVLVLAQTIQRVEKMVCIIKILKQNGIKLQMRYEMFII